MPKAVALVEDLLFLSRIREAGRAAGVPVTAARSAVDALAAAGDASVVLVDADSDRLPWREAIAALRARPELAALPVVAFVSHVNADRASAARTAGASRVMARSSFVKELPLLLAGEPGAAAHERG
jgi:CheY-like chemotaxis protein